MRLSPFKSLFLLLVMLVFSTPSYATSGIPNTTPGYDRNTDKAWGPTCDGDYMNTIFGRAFIEGQREVVTNESLIRKPDSVLEYTCFDQLAVQAGRIPNSFSEDGNSGRLDQMIFDKVRFAFDAHIGQGFTHDYLGTPDDGGGDDYDRAGGPGDYACQEMAAIWDLARCGDVMMPFYTFEELISGSPTNPADPRQMPQSCGNPNAINPDLVALAQNTDNQFARKDDFPNYKDVLKPQTQDCAEPYSTGAQVISYIDFEGGNPGDSPVNEAEFICPTPGCYYEDGECIRP